MKTITHAIVTALFVVGATATAFAAAIPPGCVPAVQNWQNGSGYTCPVADAGGTASPGRVDHCKKSDTCDDDTEGGGDTASKSKS